MKHTDGTVIDTERNNAVLALTAALSESLIRMGLEHTVGSIAGGDYQDLPVYSMETQEQMVYHLLYRPVAEKRNPGDTMYHFLRSNLKNTYTKLVYITPEYEESVIRQAAREVDLTMDPGGQPGRIFLCGCEGIHRASSRCGEVQRTDTSYDHLR